MSGRFVKQLPNLHGHPPLTPAGVLLRFRMTLPVGARAVPNGASEPLTPATYSVPPLAPFSVGCIDMVPLAEALRSDRGADTVRDVDAYLESAAAERRASAWPTPGSARCLAGQR